MTYDVVITRRADRQLDDIYGWYVKHASAQADAWWDGILEGLNSLAENPERYGLAHESASLPVRLREMLFGLGGEFTHRVLFAIRPGKVVVYAIRHCAQDDVTASDI